MRVYLDPNNAELKAKYDELFAQIAADTSKAVVDLPTYFDALENIKTGSQKYKYFRIPLDEPCFTINMSTRAISVPKDFATYGLGVKGDTRAEIVFFESDRFFDQVDLKSTNCWIQWVNTSTQAKGNSQSVYMDATEDKLLFGWVITEAMTSGAGNIEFAVRWFTTDDSGNVSYSVSTQKATCSIKSSLDLDVKDLQPELDIENILINRPKYSGVINSLDGSAAVIEENLVAGDYNLTQPAKGDDLWAEYQTAGEKLPDEMVSLDDNSDKVHDGVYKFTIVAKAPNEDSVVTYQWYNGSKQLNGETKADYVAYEAGNYYVKIGCKENKGGAGTRYINSNTVTIPAAKDIKFSADRIFPSFAWYYSEEDKANKNITFNCTAVDKETGKLPNGTVIYTFSKRDLTNVEGAPVEIENNNMATYKFTEAFEGYLSCSAYNRVNNTISNKITTNDEQCFVRMYPIKLPEPVLTLGENNKKLTATVSSSDLKWAISMKHDKEFVYHWNTTDVTNGEQKNWLPETSATADLTKLPKPATGKTQYTISCNVKHVVTPPEGSAMTQQASPVSLSDNISVYVDSQGNITPA